MSKIMQLLSWVAGLDALLDRLRKELCDCGTYYNDPTEHADYCVYRKAVMEEKP